MVNKETLDELTGYINKLGQLTASIHEREIYPVSFFSQAFDVTNKIQDTLHQIELMQIELFERQMKEHQAQIRSIQPISSRKTPAGETIPTTPIPTQNVAPPPIQPEAKKEAPAISKEETTINSHEETPRSTPPPPAPQPETTKTVPPEEKQQVTSDTLDKKFEKKTLSDLKIAFTLNDRFRFCRELFSSNENLMNQTFTSLNKLESYDSSLAYIQEHFNWDPEDGIVAEFLAMIEKRFE